MNFSALIQTIQQTHTVLQQQAANAMNRALTISNWLIGYYIVEFEQKGEDRAVYGERVIIGIITIIEYQGSFRNKSESKPAFL